MTDKEKLAIRINEIFHDIEGQKYQEKHDDIFTGEALRWQKTASSVFRKYKNPITILDVGTGTGFIPLNTAQYLSENDTFICSDISQKMLDLTKKNISNKNFKCNFRYLKLDGKSINAENITIITMNSVVHHIPNLETFFTQLNKIVHGGGRIIIGHEPNKLFYSEKSLLKRYLFFQTFSSFKRLTISIARLTRMNILLKKIFQNKIKTNKTTNEINEILMKEGFIKKELTTDYLNQMIDYHSPSAGSQFDKTKGVDIEDIRTKYLPGFETEYFETYNFLSKMSNRNVFMKKLNNSLSEKYKGKGATFFVVLKKKNANNEN